MHWLDHLVLFGYFAVMIAIGVISSWKIKGQEDFFMGGRGFGKLLQTFAAFGAGTGSSDPVNTARTTFTSGMSGMWSVMYWLFVTPFYWITGVWYRRMRHLTLGDWFVERYESPAMGAAYGVFGILFFMVYGSMFFSAIGKTAAPLMNIDAIAFGDTQISTEYLFVPVIGVVVLVYGILGGLRAAYFTDLIQGLCIILLSIVLIPFGLNALVEQFGDPNQQGMLAGFRILHDQLPLEHFQVIGSSSTSEFPLYRILAIVVINLVGIVVQPHFIATGGGSAKTEMNARVGLVVGNFLKRFCTIGWVLTALIALALYSNRPELLADPDKTWGVASRELLGPGLTGLMLACLLAALMSSIDVYMIVGSALVVRNIYAPYVNPNGTEKEYVRVARFTGALVVGGAVLISLFMMDMFAQLQLTWVFPVLFAAPFWVGMYWRRATTTAAWVTVAYCGIMFFAAPNLAPSIPGLDTNQKYAVASDVVVTTTTRNAAPSDIAQRDAEIDIWNTEFKMAQERLEKAQIAGSQPEIDRAQQAVDELRSNQPERLSVGAPISQTKTTGGVAVFWGDGVLPVDEEGTILTTVKPAVVKDEQIDEFTRRTVLRYADDVRLKGSGKFKLDLILYQWLGVDLRTKSDAMLDTLGLPLKIIAPFLVMIVCSLVTRRNSKAALDRYYAKMHTPVDPDHEGDAKRLQAAMDDPSQTEQGKIFPGSDLEMYWPSKVDVIGFVLSFIVCFSIVGLAVWVANIGS
jgi:SSS family solute:Na+ symporter